MKVLFDLDGTLFMTEASVLRAAEETACAYGLPAPDPDAVRDLIGLPTEVFLRGLFGEAGGNPECAEYFRAHEREAVGARGRLFPGVENLLRTLRE